MDAPDRPIFILGPPRSGTSVLYKTLCTHPDVAYMHRGFKKLPQLPWLAHALERAGLVGSTPKEASAFWDRYRAGRLDVMTADEVTPAIRTWYRKVVEGVLRVTGRKRFVAKCPPHSVRVPWIDAIFPDAQFVVAVRDWRAVVCSTAIKRDANEERQRREFFGIRVPGHKRMKTLASEHSAARIYRVVHEMLEGWEAELPGRFHHVVYSRLCADPRAELREVARFCDLSWSDEFEASLPESQPNSNYKWRDTLDPELLERIREEEGPELDRFTEEALTAS
jgi:hypothetical protein